MTVQGEVTPGYQRTNFGVIPKDWLTVAATALGSVQTGPFGTLLKASEYSRSAGVPIISVGEIGDGRFHISDKTPLAPEDVTRRLPEFLLRPGDIVFGRKGAVDRSCLVTHKEDGWFLGSDGIRLRPANDVEPAFLAALLQSSPIRSWLLTHSSGTTMATLSHGVLQRLILPLPPIPEQRAIAAALADAGALIAALEGMIGKKRDLKQAAMQHLLTGRTRLPGFSGDWDMKRLGEIAAIRNHKINTFDVDAAAFCVELEQIGQNTGQIDGHSDARSRRSVKYLFQRGDVLFGRLRPYLRKFWWADRDGVCSTEIWPLIPVGNRVVSGFLFQTVQTDAFIEAASASYGTHMPRSDWKALTKFEVSLPLDPAEQTAIVEVLSDMDTDLAALEAQVAKARAVKQGMMQELLTGRVRLV